MTDISQDKLVNALRKAVSRTSLLAEGNDPELDSAIRQIRVQISKGADAAAIQTILDNVEPLLLKVDEARLTRAKHFRHTLHDLIDVLDQHGQNVPQSEKKAFETSIRSHWQSLPHWPQLLKEYLALVESTLSYSTPVDNEKRTLISRIFKRSSSPQNKLNSQEALQQVSHTLSGLLNNLALPSHYDNQISELKNALANNHTFHSFPKLLDDVIALIMVAIGNTQEGLTSYLNELNKQLASINDSIVKSYRSQKNLSESREGFNATMQQQVQEAASAVQQADDLDTLKLLINERMANISTTMSRYRKQMISQEKMSNQSISLLKSKVTRMEKDTSSLRTSLQEKLAQAMTDALTDLPNRAAYQDAILLLCASSQKNAKPLSLAICDIDFFKQVNDTWGHLAGDKVLRLVPRQIRNALNKPDLLYRYGGEEFVIVFPNTTLEDAHQRAEAIRKEVEKAPFNVNGEPVSITISIGLAELIDEEYEAFFSRADKQLYCAKEAGRNKVMVDNATPEREH